MSDFNVVANVSRALMAHLQRGLEALIPGATVALTEPPEGPGIELALIDLQEDLERRNQDLPRMGPGGLVIRAPTMPLVLRYLVAARAADPLVEQQLLGAVLHTLSARPRILPEALEGALADAGITLSVALLPLGLDDRARIWRAVRRPLRAALIYEVRGASLVPEELAARPPVVAVTAAPPAEG
jgi:hypothetical protein